MTPLLLAAALAGSSAVAVEVHTAPDAAKAEAACARLENQTVAPDGVPFKTLNELPKGVLEHAIWRKLQGCPIREVVYKGKTYYVTSSAPRFDDRPAIEKPRPRQADRLTPLSPNPARPDVR